MAQDTSAVSLGLIALTANLEPASRTPREKFHEARATIASALASADSLVHFPAASTSSARMTQTQLDAIEAEHAEASPALVGSESSSPQQAAGYERRFPKQPVSNRPTPQAAGNATRRDSFAIARRTIPLAAAQISSVTPDAVAGFSVDLILELFRDQVGRSLWIELHRIVQQASLVHVLDGATFLSIPVNLYIGLRIKCGTAQFDDPLSHSRLEIVVPVSVMCTLQLDLNLGAPALGCGSGNDARLSTARLPLQAA